MNVIVEINWVKISGLIGYGIFDCIDGVAIMMMVLIWGLFLLETALWGMVMCGE